jgi:hypothetical protein
MRSLDDALALQGATADVAFRPAFDASDEAGWAELVRDVVALANSGGGIVLLASRGGAARADAAELPRITATDVDAKVHHYTGSNLAGVRIVRTRRDDRPLLALEIEAEPYPLVFLHPSDAFESGTIWFRRGARSEPGTVEDVRRSFDREIARRMDGWLENVRRVVAAPPGSVVSVAMPSDVASNGEPGVAVRLVSDPHAPAVPRWSPDETHPHRLKHVVALVNDRLAGRAHINAFDLQCVRRVHETDRVPSFFYRSKLDGPQYSDAFVEWIVESFAREPGLFVEARAKASGGRSRKSTL